MDMSSNSRREFLKRSGAVLAGSALGLPAMLAPAAAAPVQPLTRGFFHESASSNDVALAQARAAIAQHRMREVEVQVLNRQGQPLANQAVEVVQLKHQFLFGDNNVGMDKFFRAGMAHTDRAKYYRLRFREVLNALNATCYWTERPRNDMAKTEEFQGQHQLDGFAGSVDWALANGLAVKGHPLYWGTTKAIPEWLLRYPPDTQMKFIEVRIRNLTSRFRGRVKVWDIVNEAIWEPALKNLAQRRWPHLETQENMVENIAPIIRWAREEDPEAEFLVNDYGVEANSQENLRAADGTLVNYQLQRKRYLELVRQLDRAGAPPSGIGLQCHIGGWQYPKDQQAFYDEMASASFPLHVTEFWAHTDHLPLAGSTAPAARQARVTSEEWRSSQKGRKGRTYSQQEIDQLQAEYVANYLTTAFGHPAIKSFYFWGFMGMGVDWKSPNPTDAGHELRPVFHRVKELIHQEWRTREQLTTSSEGKVRFKGFFGDYSLRVLNPGGGQPAIGTPFSLQQQHAGPLVLQTLAV